MLNYTIIVSMMLCRMPKFLKGRLYLSASDAVWSPVEHIDESLCKYFTDELGNSFVDYGGFLQMIDPEALEIFAKGELFACFRGVEKNILKHIQSYPPKNIYENISSQLRLAGWDICTGNGWLAASAHGCFPVDPVTGSEIDNNADQINEFGLFNNFSDCQMYCEVNNVKIPEHAPWYPVAVFLDVHSYDRLEKFLKEQIEPWKH